MFVDPVCPFCWVTSKWVRQVQRLRGIEVGWRFISLAVLNDRPGAYDDKPDLYPEVHDLGRRLLRVAAAARAEHGPQVIGELYRQMGHALWERPDEQVGDFDDVLAVQANGIAEALSRAGDDVGTPILSFSPPDGPAVFGPVISDAPSDDDALRYWDALTTLADMPGFAEIKRTLRSFPVTALTRPLAGSTTMAS